MKDCLKFNIPGAIVLRICFLFETIGSVGLEALQKTRRGGKQNQGILI